ncbi:flagellar hook-basal body complex protein FliE [Paenibacillus macerans]|uniref:Flagellar hook-basal body complex protein FliE n=1 Tax=Paenibacillus macerans TaxID=44252 RepID=A0A090Y995_PAEMA|nr:flagellar hook-basal body complex protein FliE [Paenibacillus macerans]GBK63370.1 flagellar hook-basal body complex protein FliE [Paenibacillus macerans]GBK69683.1 flagellar hook-basal body complex protein FliE [Paenibacillus macerans]SUA82797.1 flagellar hook-basal body complex subunit FliE [Paenibacillus macerans]
MIERMSFDAVKSLVGPQLPSKPQVPTPAESIKSFSSYLSDALDGVAAQETNAQTVNDQFMLGNASADQMMIASEQALLSLQLTTQVRNKVIEAYQEIMRTQI